MDGLDPLYYLLMYTYTYMPFIMPNHYWIVLLSIVVIILFSLSKYKLFALTGLIISSTIILNDYGIARAIVHIMLTMLTVALFKIAILSLKQKPRPFK